MHVDTIVAPPTASPGFEARRPGVPCPARVPGDLRRDPWAEWSRGLIGNSGRFGRPAGWA